MSSAYLGFECLKFGSLLGGLWVCGRAVQAGLIRVNYTRKINHFLLFTWQFTLRDGRLGDVGAGLHLLDNALILLCTVGLFVAPLRSRFPVLATMFAAYDRPEDRPHTLAWVSLQLALSFAVAGPLHLYFESIGKPQLLTILILVNGIGDGLAEPVGVRYGRHRYAVSALFTQRRYTRSVEGSACVFLSAVGAIAWYAGSFSPLECVAALLLVPAAVTLAEARAPHTLDSPLIFLVGGLLLMAIERLV